MQIKYLAIVVIFLAFSSSSLVFAQTSHGIMGKIAFSHETYNLMVKSCGKINDAGDVDPQVIQYIKQNNPNVIVSNDNARGLFWNTLYAKSVSNVPEFKSLGGINDTIHIKMDENVALSCPPLQGGNATFNVHGNNLTYQIGFYSDVQDFYYKSPSFIHTTDSLGKPLLNNTHQSTLLYGSMGSTPVVKIESPLKQLKHGTIPNDVTCLQGFQLMLKASNGSPACMRPQTKIQLLERGWILPSLKDFGYNPGRGPSTLEKQTSAKFSNIGSNPFPSSTLSRLVFFMKSNSIAKIYIQYTSGYENTGNVGMGGQFYTGDPHNFIEINSTQITISSSPDHVSMSLGTNTTVAYSISVKNIPSGLYWMVLTQICGAIPVAIDMDSSHILPSDVPVYSQHCPAQVLNYKILGISGGTAEYKLSQELQ